MFSAEIDHDYVGNELATNIIINNTETATRGVLWKKVFLEFSENSQGNTCAWGLRSATLLK